MLDRFLSLAAGHTIGTTTLSRFVASNPLADVGNDGVGGAPQLVSVDQVLRPAVEQFIDSVLDHFGRVERAMISHAPRYVRRVRRPALFDRSELQFNASAACLPAPMATQFGHAV